LKIDWSSNVYFSSFSIGKGINLAVDEWRKAVMKTQVERDHMFQLGILLINPTINVEDQPAPCLYEGKALKTCVCKESGQHCKEIASYQKKATVLSFKRVKNSKKDTEAMDFNRGFCTCAIHSLAQGYAAHRCRMASHEGPT